MDFTLTQENNLQIISLKGSLLALVEAHERELLDRITDVIQNGNNKFIFDLKDIKFVNSSGLGILLTCLTKSRRAGGDVVLTNVPDQVTTLLKITKLDKVFLVANSAEEAKKQFSA